MCFSAPASFVASGGLIAMGSASLAISKKEQKVLAVIPLFFGIQQFFEGIQWISLNAGVPSLLAAYGFLFFAFILWPIYVPTFVFIMNKERRKILGWFIVLGVVIALYFVWLFLTRPLFVGELRACISYDFKMPFNPLMIIPYIVATLGPLFVARGPGFRIFGVIVALSALVSWIFFTVVFTSVWCFFAAIISSLIFFYILQENKKHR